MADEQPEDIADLQRQVDKLAAQVTINRADIDALQFRTADARGRADAIDAHVEAERQRIDALEVRVDIDKELITELLTEGVVQREHADQLKEALASSRKIGAAIGIVMANRRITDEQAFEVLRRASQLANRKIRVLADDIVRTGDVSELPGASPCDHGPQRSDDRDVSP
jgi:hypothetical protein